MHTVNIFRCLWLISLSFGFVVCSAYAQNHVLSLDGDGDYVRIPNAPEFHGGENVVKTIEAWFMPREMNFPIVGKTLDATVKDWSINHSEQGQIQFWSEVNGDYQPSSASRLALNRWYHVAVVINRPQRLLRLYLNGVLIREDADMSNESAATTAPVEIGAHTYRQSFAAGYIDEVRIWNVARTTAQIRATMFASIHGDEPGLVGHWPFEGGVENPATDGTKTVLDATGNGRDGQLLGDASLIAMEKPARLPQPAVVSGMIHNKAGTPLAGAEVVLEQDNTVVVETQTDTNGRCHLAIFPKAAYDLYATLGTDGALREGIRLHEGEHRTLNLTAKAARHIEGRLRMFDDVTPHVAVPVQVIRGGKVIAGTLSDKRGMYRFVNLKPGRYQVRCQVRDGYAYYSSKPDLLTSSLPSSQPTISRESVEVKPDMTLPNIDFRLAPFKKGRWKHYTSLDGLAGNRVNAIHWNPDGTLWFATEGSGVSYYDGNVFVNFDTKDGLVSNWVRVIHQDPAGVLWFGTMDGVSRYAPPLSLLSKGGHKGGFVNFTTEDGLAHNNVRAIHSDPSDRNLWFATEGGGISRYDREVSGRGRFVTFTRKDGLPSNSVYAIHHGTDGVMWFGTAGGASRYAPPLSPLSKGGRKGGFVNFTTKDGLPHNKVNAIHRDVSGTMWFGTDSGVARYDGKAFVNLTAKDGLVNNIVTFIYGDPDGTMWFGTEGGVSRYGEADLTDGGYQQDKGTFVNYTTTDGLASNVLRAIHRAPDGAMWFGVYGGVSRYDEKGIVNYATKDGLGSGHVTAIHREPDGTLWFGTYGGGVSRAVYPKRSGREEADFTNPTGFITFTTKNGLAHNNVNDIHSAPGGILWFGTDNGVSRYDTEFVTFAIKDGLPHNKVNAIYCQPDGVIWFGTAGGGVSRYDGKASRQGRDLRKQFISFTTEDGLAMDHLRDIHPGPNGMIWFATGGGVSRGVYPEPRRDGKLFVNLTSQDGLASNHLRDIHHDFDGAMWFATADGASRYDPPLSPLSKGGRKGGFVNFTVADGLAHNSVLAIYSHPSDRDAVMWFGTGGGGVCWYDGIAWTSLDTRDGLAGNEVFSIHQDNNGYLWFGTNGGITRYRPDTTPPRVSIISVKTDREYTNFQASQETSAQPSGLIPSTTTGSRVTVKYSAVDFKTAPEKRQYQVKIGNQVSSPSKLRINSARSRDSGAIKQSSKWILETITRGDHLDWTPKKSGIYTFEVQAIDRDLNYSEVADVTLKVVPPWYLNGWIALPSGGGILALLIGCIVYGTRYYAQRRQVLAYQRAAVEELQDAQRVQMALMPDAAPEIAGVEIAGKCIPAREVTGDFFDYLEGKQPNEMGIVIADVTGKAMKGAMNAVMTDGILHSKAEEMEQLSPAALLAKLNNVLQARLEQYMNVTMVIGLINGETKTLTLANAAHHAYPLLLRDGKVESLVTRGMPLGMRAGIRYREVEFPLANSDVVIFMTDGIIEAQDSEGNFYSESGRLGRIVSQFTLDLSAEAMVEVVINDAIAFSGEKAQRDDDITVVVAKIQ